MPTVCPLLHNRLLVYIHPIGVVVRGHVFPVQETYSLYSFTNIPCVSTMTQAGSKTLTKTQSLPSRTSPSS
jgi:hypothetical protein